MLWQYLGNAGCAQAEEFRKLVEETCGAGFTPTLLGGDKDRPQTQVYRAPELTTEGQRKLFHKLAGEWMGRDRRRGFPYTWVPNHLADARGRTSPRSFLTALRRAAEATDVRHPDHEFALHYESIKEGVRKASEIRKRELEEDYPWVDTLMQPLEGLNVPCEFQEVAERWQAGPIQEIAQRAGKGLERLPPARLEKGPEGLREDLEGLGVFLRLRDGRVNIPDVFRLAYGLGRKGGVKPAR